MASEEGLSNRVVYLQSQLIRRLELVGLWAWGIKANVGELVRFCLREKRKTEEERSIFLSLP